MGLLENLDSSCFVYQRPAVLVPPVDFLDLDLALVDVAGRVEAEDKDISRVNDPIVGEMFEYTVLT